MKKRFNSAEIQDAKSRVTALFQDLDAAKPGESAGALGPHVTGDFSWYGMHPFHEQAGPDAVAQRFWDPLKSSFTALQRRLDVFFAGHNEIDEWASTWVVSMGHLLGLFDLPWLGIAPTRKIGMLRFAEFHRVAKGKIVEAATFVDIPHLMIQAGCNPWPQATAQHLVQPGPQTHDGVMLQAQDMDEGDNTLSAINAMIKDLGTWQLGIPVEEELRRTWHEDMIWWGPAGIGASYTINRYAEQHAKPFRAGFSDRTRTNHRARLAEGHFGGFFGWPNFTARPTGGFMGMPASDAPGPFRVVDIYRRSGDKLAENWIFIDLLHYFACQGVDVLSEATAATP
ncbi:MAG: ester cyclase [Pseudomonadota bacterium]